MEKAIIRLHRSLCGWLLVPFSENSKSFLSEMYVFPEGYDNVESKDKFFMKGEPIEKVIAHVKEVCKGMKISVSLCGNKQWPTICLWRNFPPIPPEVINVDLKWSLWMNDESFWEERYPGTWNKMVNAFKGGTPVCIYTAPWKEIRYGKVIIEKGIAHGNFSCGWDDCESLADTLNTECDEAFYETIPYSMYLDERGIDWDFSVKAKTFNKLMQRIDDEEGYLLEHDQQEWKAIERMFDRTIPTSEM